jgi:hypothetical protein
VKERGWAGALRRETVMGLAWVLVKVMVMGWARRLVRERG